jgi:regulation of enolase protein 1 (concanavalin A-like superfamily)
MKEPITWLNPPANWHFAANGLVLSTGNETDFWRKTEYGFIRDSGHFAYRTMAGDFSAEVTFTADYQVLYDQAGLMMRLDPIRWIKTGIEFVDGVMNFSTVVTNDVSDWSLAPYPPALQNKSVRARLIRRGSTVSTAFRRVDGSWQTVRVAGFSASASCHIGVMCCSPQRAGLQACFTEFVVAPLAAV